MLWPRTASPVASSSLSDLAPSNEDLRRAVLQASWDRDRRVGRRRLAARWVQWALWRYVLPAFLVLGAAALVWSWLLPEAPALIVQAQSRSWTRPPSTTPTAPVAEPRAADKLLPEPQVLATGAGVTTEVPDTLKLHFESNWGKPRMPDPQSDPIDTQSLPTLKPENWLHSKEP